jgi:predicted RNA binding protein YcfA (HicA-like mRNA interferase family)
VSKLPSVKPKNLAKIAERLGFVFDRQKGSHAVYLRHEDHRRTVIPMHNKDLKPGTLRGILADLGITSEELIKLL